MGEIVYLFGHAHRPLPDTDPAKPLGLFIKRLAYGAAVVPHGAGLSCRVCGGYGQTAAEMAVGHSDTCLLAGFEGAGIDIPAETDGA